MWCYVAWVVDDYDGLDTFQVWCYVAGVVDDYDGLDTC